MGVPFGELLDEGASTESSLLPHGSVIGCWRGSSGDPSVRSASSSGGFATSLIIHALESNLADGVMVTRMSKDDPFRAEAVIARSPADVLGAAGSKYLPVPLNTLLAQVSESDDRVIAVGLPCHVHGIRLAQKVRPKLKKSIPICLSLVCHHTPSCLAMDFILGRLKLAKDRVKRVEYRAGSWPGGLRFSLGDGTNVELPYSSELYWGGLLQRFFIPDRCLMCVDKMSILSDIAFMDAWRVSPGLSDQSTGLAVTRTPLGEQIFQSAVSSGSIVANQVAYESVQNSQDVLSHFRLRCSLIEVARRRGHVVPLYGLDETLFESSSLANARLAKFLNSASYRRRAWPALSVYSYTSSVRRRLKSHGRESPKQQSGPIT